MWQLKEPFENHPIRWTDEIQLKAWKHSLSMKQTSKKSHKYGPT
ncbi:hypothetical protein [Rubritalea sp.]